MNIKGLFRTLTLNPSKEQFLVKMFLIDPSMYVEALTQYFNDHPMFKGQGRDYTSPYGCVKVCCDIYGPEVKVGGVNEMLDCRPSAYQLTREQATPLYHAILSCVPGTIPAEEKVKRNQGTF